MPKAVKLLDSVSGSRIHALYDKERVSSGHVLLLPDDLAEHYISVGVAEETTEGPTILRHESLREAEEDGVYRCHHPTDDGGRCPRKVDGPDDTCWQH